MHKIDGARRPAEQADGMRDGARPADLVGVVLVGGFSSRLGTHKPALKLHGEARPDLLTRTIGLLRSVTAEVWVSCRQGQTVPDCRCLHDLHEGLGPLGGIVSVLTALAPSPFQGALILSCDLPFMNESTLSRLVDARRGAKPGALMTTFLQAETGYIEALTAIYEKEALPFFEQAVARRQRQINLVIRTDWRTDVMYTRNEALPFFNVNYPADLETARQLAAYADLG
jgi:molybdopterin-guanine dinucleotide biosynthesis protein A